MPNPKKVGDDLIVKLRPDWSRGGADLWETRDAFAAVCQELDKIYAASQLADFATMKAALASGRTSIVFIDEK